MPLDCLCSPIALRDFGGKRFISNVFIIIIIIIIYIFLSTVLVTFTKTGPNF